jgi:hypothetical protein
MREEILNFIESNEGKHTAYQNLCDTARAVLRRKFVVLSAFIF